MAAVLLVVVIFKVYQKLTGGAAPAAVVDEPAPVAAVPEAPAGAPRGGGRAAQVPQELPLGYCLPLGSCRESSRGVVPCLAAALQPRP